MSAISAILMKAMTSIGSISAKDCRFCANNHTKRHLNLPEHKQPKEEHMRYPEIAAILQHIAHDVEMGNGSALKAYVALKEIADQVEQVLDQIKHVAVDERRRYGKENPIIDGIQIELAAGRKIWKYDHSSTWQQLNERRKTLESLMQKAYNGASIVDGDTGEQIEPAGLSFSADTIRLTKPRN